MYNSLYDPKRFGHKAIGETFSMKYISQGAGKRESKQTTADQKKKNQENAEQTNTLCHRSWFCFNSLFYSVFPVILCKSKRSV